MKKCKKCENNIPTRMYIDGKLKLTASRKYCFECSPYKQHNTKQLHIAENKPMINTCRVCQKDYMGGHQQYKNICSNCRVNKCRQEKKIKAVEYMGGHCIICKYNKCITALHFHHIDPNEKEYGFSSNLTKPFEVLKKELDKCIMVCSNCHSEIHAGMIEIDEYISLQNVITQAYIPEVKPEKFYQPIIKISKRPAKDVLEKLVWEISCVKIGEMYGVSDNAVNKWCKYYDIKKPGRGDWEKIKTGKIHKPSF